MKRYELILLLVLLLLSTCFDTLHAQNKVISKKSEHRTVNSSPDYIMVHHALYLEGGGSARFYSLNYEYRFGTHLSGRLSYGGFNPQIANLGYSLILLNAFVGSAPHWLELGAGPRYTIRSSFRSGVFTDPEINGIVGYRFQPAARGILIRLSFTPFRVEPLLWGGVSIGYSF